MQTISWEENDFGNEEEGVSNQLSPTQEKEKVDDKNVQLEKFLDPAKSHPRQEYIAILEEFGHLLMNGNITRLANELLSEDFEMFIFSTKRKPVQHAKSPQGFIDLYQNTQVQERCVKETYIDIKKETACQIGYYRCANPGDDIFSGGDVVYEIFTIKDGKISKYRACSSSSTIAEGRTVNPFELIRKDLMLAKVKQINYALAGELNFEKVASLLGDSVEYKIWRWEDYKCFTLQKENFASSFKLDLEENMSIKCVIPYEISFDSQTKCVSATYLYELEEKSSGKKYDWLSTCLYAFDEKSNIIKVSHQGETYPEGEAEIPFKSYTDEKLADKFRAFYAEINFNFDILYNSEIILFDCRFHLFCFDGMPSPGHFQGIKQIDKVMNGVGLMRGVKLDYIKPVDVFVDVQSTGYDVVFGVVCGQAVGLNTEAQNENKTTNDVGFVIMSFENGKLAKMVDLISDVSDPIESPFDDKTFHCLNIKSSSNT